MEEYTKVTLEIRIRKAGVVPILELEGEVDLSTSPRLKQAVYNLIEAGNKNIVLDLSGVKFMDSTGLGTLVGALKKTSMQSGTVKLICPSKNILKTFTLTGLDKVFLIYDNLRECLGE